MLVAGVHIRRLKSDYDETSGPDLFDNDARQGALCGYRQALKFIKKFRQNKAQAKKYPGFDLEQSRLMLKQSLPIISAHFWHALDFDDRKKSADVKPHARKLVTPLTSLKDVLDRQPLFVRKALNYEVRRKTAGDLGADSDSVAELETLVSALLDASNHFVSIGHRKSGGAIKCHKACRDLAKLWEDMTRKPFPKNTKTPATKDLSSKRAKASEFESVGAQFVFVTLNAIGRGMVKVSQVQEALKIMQGENRPPLP